MEHLIHRIAPYHTFDKTRLELIHPITEAELLHWIRHTKERALGFTTITRNMILNLPRSCLLTLTDILNSALSTGYFIDTFKQAKMIFIHKEDKDNTQVINHRPISLLEVIGKLYKKKHQR